MGGVFFYQDRLLETNYHHSLIVLGNHIAHLTILEPPIVGATLVLFGPRELTQYSKDWRCSIVEA